MKILDELGIKPGNLGYTYWEEAIKLRKGIYYDIKMGEIYNEIAKKYNTTYVRVERNMRRSRESIKGLNKKIKTDFTIDNKNFLAILVKKMAEENDE